MSINLDTSTCGPFDLITFKCYPILVSLYFSNVYSFIFRRRTNIFLFLNNKFCCCVCVFFSNEKHIKCIYFVALILCAALTTHYSLQLYLFCYVFKNVRLCIYDSLCDQTVITSAFIAIFYKLHHSQVKIVWSFLLSFCILYFCCPEKCSV